MRVINVTLRSCCGSLTTLTLKTVSELESVIDAVDFTNAVQRDSYGGWTHRVTVEVSSYDGDPQDLELGADDVDAIGLDSSGRSGDERFPYTYASLTWQERDELRAHWQAEKEAC